MEKWEYITVKHLTELNDELLNKDYGNNGWELISLIKDKKTFSYTFKRKKEDQKLDNSNKSNEETTKLVEKEKDKTIICSHCNSIIQYNDEDTKVGEIEYYVYGCELNFAEYSYVICPKCGKETRIKK